MPIILPHVKDIVASLPPQLQHLQVCVYPSLDSTNTHARRLLTEGQITTDTLLVAHTQTAGRGRLGRSFFSPVGQGLYMTLVLPCPQIPPHATPAAAVAAALAIKDWTMRECLIKWVNDLYLDGRKVCGILTEAAQDTKGLMYLLIGIGINITTQQFPNQLRHPAGCILTDTMQSQHTCDLSTLISRILCHLYALLYDPTQCLQNYRDRFFLTGHTVTYAYVCTPDAQEDTSSAVSEKTVTGVVEGVDENYCLQLRLPDGRRLSLCSGEVTHISI